MITLRKAIEELSRKNYFFEKLYILASLQEQSEAILGKNISNHCKFSEFKNGTLYIECDDYIWANAEKTNKEEDSRQVESYS